MLKFSLSLFAVALLYTGCGSNNCCDGDNALEEEGNRTALKVAPTAVLSSETKECTEGSTIRFDGRNSVDPDGFVQNYLWIIDGKEVATAPVPAFACDVPGEKEVCLKVTDNDGLVSSVVCQNYIVKEKEVVQIPPKAIIEAPEFCTIGEKITVNGVKSSDSDGEVMAYTWSFEEQNATAKEATFTCAKVGAQELCLKVTDNDGLTDSNCTTVVGQEIPNEPPVAKIVVAEPSCIIGETITLDGSQSSDTDGTVTHYVWTPQGVDAASYEFNCTQEGTYDVCLSVVDDKDLNSTQACETIAVSKPANKPPVARIELLPQECVVGETVLADGTTSSDVDGNVTAYHWSVDNNISYSIEPKPQILCEKEGDMKVCLSVTDNEGADSLQEACKFVTVNPKPNVTIPPVAVITIVPNDDTVKSVTAECEGSYDPDTVDGDNNPQNDGKILDAKFTVQKTYKDGYTEDPHTGDCPKWISTPDNLDYMKITLTVTDDDGEVTEKTEIYDWDGEKLVLRQ